MNWTNEEISALVEPDRAHRKAYVDPDLFDLEMERIFESAWVYVGHESQVKNPGDYYLARIGRQPMMMTRDFHGEIHVLYSRHRNGEGYRAEWAVPPIQPPAKKKAQGLYPPCICVCKAHKQNQGHS